jgi:hypothetical protein
MDTLNGYIITNNGAKFTSSATPHALTYGSASNYDDLDTTGLVIGGELRLRMFRKNDTSNVITQVALPPTPGRTYTILLFGHVGYWLCEFPVKQPDGSVLQRVINYPPNIKGYVRTID